MTSVTENALRKERRAQRSNLLRGAAMMLLGLGCVYYRLLRGQPGLFGLAAMILFSLMTALGALVLFRAIYRSIPSHSMLLRSALSQAEDGETLQNLRAQIDRDLQAPRARFGSVAVGARWIVGDGAMKLSRVCGVFHVTHGMWHLLCLADVDGNVQGTSMEQDQLREAAEWLRGALPLAVHGDMEDYRAFLDLEPEKRWRHAPLRERKPWSLSLLAFWTAEGIPTSNFTPEDLDTALTALEPEQAVGFTLLDPVDHPERTILGMFAEKTDLGERIAVTYEDADGPGRAVKPAGIAEIQAAFARLLETGELPDISAWIMEPWKREETLPYELHVDGDTFHHPAIEDIEAVLTGMDEGLYQSFSLMRPDRSTGGMFADKAEEGYRVMAAAPSREGIRWMETFTKRRDQVRFWMEGYFSQSVFPYLGGWEDITEQMERDPR